MSGLAIVTGGARGIGLAICQQLLDQGVVDRVAAFDLQTELAEPNDAIDLYHCDVTDEDSVRAAYEQVGTVPTVLVNNAGGGRVDRIDGTGDAFDPFSPVDSFREMVELNFISAHVVTRVIGPDLAEGAAICNTASIAGLGPVRLFAYGAAKAALIHWTTSMAQNLAPKKIRVNAVAPGIIRTKLWEALQPDDEAYDTMISDIMPMQQDQSPTDIANAVAFLCSSRAAQVTGEVIKVDGGLTLR